MLKSCWDCLIGYDLMRDQAREEAHTSTELNGLSTRAPPWPQAQLKNENMYILPTKLNSRDTIVIRGEMLNDSRLLSLGLITGYSSPDYENIACLLEVNYPPNNEDKIVIKVVKDGYHQLINSDNSTSDYFPDTNFSVAFKMRDEGYLDIHVGESYLEQIQLKHNIDDIRFLAVSGDVSKVFGLEFQFG